MKKFECELCNYSTSRKSNLDKHFKNNTHKKLSSKKSEKKKEKEKK